MLLLRALRSARRALDSSTNPCRQFSQSASISSYRFTRAVKASRSASVLADCSSLRSSAPMSPTNRCRTTQAFACSSPEVQSFQHCVIGYVILDGKQLLFSASSHPNLSNSQKDQRDHQQVDGNGRPASPFDLEHGNQHWNDRESCEDRRDGPSTNCLLREASAKHVAQP